MDQKRLLACVSGCFKKAKAAFAMSCYFNFTSVCKIGNVYLFYKNEEGLLIEKDNTSVSQFTVLMPPVCHLICQ